MPATDSAGTSTRSIVLDETRSAIVAGLAVGVVLGFGGNFVEQGHVQDVMYGLSAVGLIVASVLLAIELASAGARLSAAGFVLLALGEVRVVNPTDVPGGEAGFAVGVLLYAPALLLLGRSTWAPRWVRLVGTVAAIPFAAHALTFLSGADIDSTGPLAGVGYTLLTVTMIGWVLTVLRSPGFRHP